MKLNARTPRDEGGILIVTLVIAGLVGIMLASYLKMISSQNTYTFRSQVWNSAIPLCEAGIEEAMAHLNALGTNNNFGIRGWTTETNGYVKERTLDDGTYRAIIDTNFPPIITVYGRVRAPLQTTKYITRALQVKTKWNRKFPQAILAKSLLELGGTSSRIDSFISTNNLYSTGGQYDAAKSRDEAPVACLATTPGNFDIANTRIYGRVGSTPGGNVTIGAGAVGDKTWVPLNTGIQPGHQVTDLNLYVPDVVFPSPYGPVFFPGDATIGGTVVLGITIGGTYYKYLFDDGDYQMSTFNLGSGDKAIVVGNARLHVQGQLTVGSTAYIEIATNASFVVYCGGQVDIKGQGVINRIGYAANFSLLGLNTCTSIDYGGSSKFIGTVYAPRARVKMGGGAATIGAVVANEFDFNGGFEFHYDECLQGRAETGRFLIASWIEL